MQVGWCAPTQQTALVKSAGYDFVEVKLAPMNLEDDDCFGVARKAVRRAELPQPVFCQFLPKPMTVLGPNVDRERIRKYLDRVVDVVAAADGEMIVFGSGWARNVPEGWSRERAADQFIEMVSWCTDAFQGSGVLLALEHQNRTETNFLTTFAESVELAKRIGHPGVKVISDMYHLYMESESLALVAECIDWIAHVHLSDSERKTPGHGTYDFDSYFRTLRAANYRGRMSVEIFADTPVAEMRRSADWVRGRFESVKT